MKFTNLRVANRLAVAFGLVFILLLGISLASGLLLRKINHNVEDYASNIVPSLDNISGILEASGTLRRIEAFYILADEDKERTDFEKRIADERKRLTGLVENYKQYIVDDRDRRNWGAVDSGVRNYLATWDELRFLTQQGLTDPKMQSAAADMLRFGKSKEAFTAVQKAVQVLSDYNKELSLAMNRQSQQAYRTAITVLVVCSVLALLLGFVLSVLVARSITNELGGEPQDASQLARAIANGDLSVRVEVKPGADSSMMASFKHMVQSLSAVVTEVRQNAESVATVSQQIAQGNHDLSQRTEEQASALEQTAASMEELGSTARMNADNVKQVNQLAAAATNVASKGGHVVGQVIHTMHGINEASRQIGDIINVIDGIAFQTNILALNAAVEAARAGEQGRGFAVVAGEVRSLAQRSAGAAKEIKALINTSVERVNEGSALVDQAGQTIAEVVTSVKHVTDLMAEINVAINEQTANVAQVSNAVGQMDKVTQQNAALVEESAAAAHNLKDQAQEMVKVVAVFKLA